MMKSQLYPTKEKSLQLFTETAEMIMSIQPFFYEKINKQLTFLELSLNSTPSINAMLLKSQ